MYRYSVSDLSKEEHDKLKENYGGFNEAPPNFVEISREEFDEKFLAGAYSPQYTDFRQCLRYADGTPIEGGFLPIHLYIYHDGNGVASSARYLSGGKYEYKFFKFGLCEHEMQHVAVLGNCYNRYKCSKCGYVREVDSSD